jgi:hypothetical protein
MNAIKFGLIATLMLTLPTVAIAADGDWQHRIADAMGKAGQEMPGGVYRIGLPRSDLHVTLDGVDLKPGFALGGWLAFKTTGNDAAMVMGDLVLTETEVNPVMTKLEESGIEVTALHNHLLRGAPFTMYMHVYGHGEPGKLATALHAALALSKTPFESGPATPAGRASQIDLDIAALDQVLGHKGKVSGGVYQVSVARARLPKDHGMDIPESMGSAIAINFQPTGGGKAAITGDFVLTGNEVNPVLTALREHGIEVTAIHNHMLDDEPRLIFLHFWANDDTRKLAEGLRAALGKVNTAKT